MRLTSKINHLYKKDITYKTVHSVVKLLSFALQSQQKAFHKKMYSITTWGIWPHPLHTYHKHHILLYLTHHNPKYWKLFTIYRELIINYFNLRLIQLLTNLWTFDISFIHLWLWIVRLPIRILVPINSMVNRLKFNLWTKTNIISTYETEIIL